MNPLLLALTLAAAPPSLSGSATVTAGGGKLLVWPDFGPKIAFRHASLAERAEIRLAWPARQLPVLVFEEEAASTFVFSGAAVPVDAPAPGSGGLALVGLDLEWLGVRVGYAGLGKGLGGFALGGGGYDPSYAEWDLGQLPLFGPICWRLWVGRPGLIRLVLGHFDDVSPARFGASRIGVRFTRAFVSIEVDGTIDDWFIPRWTSPEAGVSGEAVLRVWPALAFLAQANLLPPESANTRSWEMALGVKMTLGASHRRPALLAQ